MNFVRGGRDGHLEKQLAAGPVIYRASRRYWENKLNFFAPKHVAVPVAVSVFPDEICAAPRSWAEKAYPRLIHYNRLPKGGHFAAWEQPQAFTEEVRASFRSLR